MSRLVLVLGRDPILDIDALIKQAWKGNLELVVLNLGWIPLSHGQQRICDTALEAAGRGLVSLEEKIVYDPADIPGLLRADDRVHLAMSSLEQKRMESAARREQRKPRGELG